MTPLPSSAAVRRTPLNLCYLTVQDASSDFCQAVHRNPATGSITVPYSLDVLQANIGELETSGFDLQGRYGFDVGWGGVGGSRFDISTAWTYTDEFTVTPMQARRRTRTNAWVPMVRPAVSRFRSSRVSPASPGYRTVRGEPAPSLHRRCDDRPIRSPQSAATTRRPGHVHESALDAQHYLDLSITYDIGDMAEIFPQGINNVLDTDPPIIVGQGGYGNTYPATYDYAGMTMFLGVTVKAF